MTLEESKLITTALRIAAGSKRLAVAVKRSHGWNQGSRDGDVAAVELSRDPIVMRDALVALEKASQCVKNGLCYMTPEDRKLIATALRVVARSERLYSFVKECGGYTSEEEDTAAMTLSPDLALLEKALTVFKEATEYVRYWLGRAQKKFGARLLWKEDEELEELRTDDMSPTLAEFRRHVVDAALAPDDQKDVPIART
jgi:hypothetical protein